MSTHHCDAIVVCCMDFRFQKYIRQWIDENLKDKSFDLVGFAGSTKDLTTIMKQIDISVKLHQTKQVVLIHHENCGAYGAESTPERHRNDLLIAKKQILAQYPQLQVDLYYLYLDGKFDSISG